MGLLPVDLTAFLAVTLIVVTVASTLAIGSYRRRLHRAQRQRDEEESRRRSLSTTYGQITEQFAPLLDAYPWDPEDFRFLGTPVDGVQFEDDRIVLVEFKANESTLSPRQRQVRRIVERGDVEWETVRLEAGDEAEDESLDRWT